MFVNLTPDEEKVKDWWKRWKECSEKYPNDSWDGMEPITETGLIGYPGFYQGDHYDLEMFTEFFFVFAKTIQYRKSRIRIIINYCISPA